MATQREKYHVRIRDATLVEWLLSAQVLGAGDDAIGIETVVTGVPVRGIYWPLIPGAERMK